MAPTRKTNPQLTVVDDSNDSVARRTIVTLSVALAFIGTLWFLYQLRAVLGMVLVSLVLALALAPMVDWLTAKRLRRGVASVLAVGTLFLITIGVVGAAATPIVSQSDELARNIPGIIEQVNDIKPIQELDQRFKLGEQLRDQSDNLPQLIAGTNANLVTTAQQTFNALLTTVVIVTLTFFMLLEGPNAWKQSIKLLKPRDARRVDRTGRKILGAIGGFVWGNLLISLITGAFTFIILTILGVPYALPLSIAVGVLDLIPFAGVVIATLILVLMALTVSVGAAIAVAILFTIYQVIESNFVVPVIYSRTVELSPLIILIATIVGATLAGLVGILLSIPAAAAIQIIIVELLRGAQQSPRRAA